MLASIDICLKTYILVGMSNTATKLHSAVHVKRDPDATRQALLNAAFEEMHAQGFRSASLDHILAKTGVTKGALYHHFPNKQALGYAVVDEIILPRAIEMWAVLRDESRNPIDAMVELLDQHRNMNEPEMLRNGCPVNNLVQEMAGIDEGFRVRLASIQSKWIRVIEDAMQRGLRTGQVRNDIDPSQVATLLVAGFEGSASLAKCAQDNKVFINCMQSMIDFVETLRA